MSIPPTEIPPRTRIDVPAPFRVLGDHFAIGLPGAWALFTTRRGGSSTGHFKSLNLGRWTDDDPEHVRANRRASANSW